MIGEIVYGLCALTSATCVLLLWRGFTRTRLRLLLWCSLGFVGLFLNNVLLFADKILLPAVDLSAVRIVPGIIGVSLVCYGLIWDADR
ncbi:MAG TPA: DUF5985 family protein [Candidatus Baltobacteraceae bacterium]|nr:DUF5985 family protein [Candidatus Baltobacteraceae bacterium]